MNDIPVWQMIQQAIHNLNGAATYTEIKNYISANWVDVNQSTINAQLIVLSVNQPSRIHYPENQNPRFTNTGNQYDLLYSVGRGQVVSYNPEEHGVWEIYKNEFDALKIRQIIDNSLEIDGVEEIDSFLFPIEANLRDFLIKNLNTFKQSKLQLFIDDQGREGKEYTTGVGIIDILSVDRDGNFFVFELKLSRGADRAIGQLLRYMGWVKQNLAKGKNVNGVVVANKMDEKIKYAVSMVPKVSLYEYEMKFELREINYTSE